MSERSEPLINPSKRETNAATGRRQVDEGAAEHTRIDETGIRAVVFTFYDRIRTEPELGPIFERRLAGRWDPHLEKMCDFWSTVLLGTARFRGNPMAMHMDIPGLRSEHFDRWIELFDQTAREVLPQHQARDIVGRSMRMRVALERAACSAVTPTALL